MYLNDMEVVSPVIVVRLLLLLILILVWPVCLDMCPYVPAPIHPHMSKAKLVIENWWNHVYSGTLHSRTTALGASGTENLEPATRLFGS